MCALLGALAPLSICVAARRECALRCRAAPHREVVLAASQDSFFATHMFANFGDLGMSVKAMLDEFAVERQSHEKIATIGVLRMLGPTFA